MLDAVRSSTPPLLAIIAPEITVLLFLLVTSLCLLPLAIGIDLAVFVVRSVWPLTSVAGVVVFVAPMLVGMHAWRAIHAACGAATTGAAQRRPRPTHHACADVAMGALVWLAAGVSSRIAFAGCRPPTWLDTFAVESRRTANWSDASASEGLRADLAVATDLAARLPPAFRFGVASSAYQIEGGLNDSNWQHAPVVGHSGSQRPANYPYGAANAGPADDSWERFDEDLALIVSLNLSAYRISIAWSRVHVAPDSFDEAALARYRRWMVAMRAAGVEPQVTLLHYEEPLWITAAGSWLRASTRRAWLGFVRTCVDALAPLVDVWITLNEPAITVGNGYFLGLWPPYQGGHPLRGLQVSRQLARAHREAYALLHARDMHDADGDGVACSVGVAVNLNPVLPGSHWNLLDPWIAGLWGVMANRVFNPPLAAAGNGGGGGGGGDGAAWLSDFVGVNHYGAIAVRVLRFYRQPQSWLDLRQERGFHVPAGLISLSWTQDGASLYAAVCEATRFAPRRHPAMAVRITEHGMLPGGYLRACNDGPAPCTHDWQRGAFLAQAVAALSAAHADGLDVRSYAFYTLLDAWEWGDGFGPRFGLFNVDRPTLRRTARESAAIYAALATAHAERGAERGDAERDVEQRRAAAAWELAREQAGI